MKNIFNRLLVASVLLPGLLLTVTACRSNNSADKAVMEAEITEDQTKAQEQKIYLEVSYFEKEKGIMKVKFWHEIKTQIRTKNTNIASEITEIVSSPTVCLKIGIPAVIHVSEVDKSPRKTAIKHKFYPKAANGEAFECTLPATNGSAFAMEIYKVVDNKATLVIVYNRNFYHRNKAGEAMNIFGEYEVELDKPMLIYQCTAEETK